MAKRSKRKSDARKTCVLIEDNPGDARLIAEMLGECCPGLRLEVFGTLGAGKRRLLRGGVTLVLLDLTLPDSIGLETLDAVRTCSPSVPVVVLTGTDDTELGAKAIAGGAQDYLVKGQVDGPLLHRASRYAVERKQGEEKLERTLDELRLALSGTVSALAAVVESHDPYTSGHQRRVAQLAMAIAQEMELEREEIDGVRVSAVLHDIGKTAVPMSILSKPSKLTEAEFELVKMHAQVAYDILLPVKLPWPVADIVYQHHERMDGSGYPRQLKGKKIHPLARILAVSDVVEAMSSHRPYRAALGMKEALGEIARGKGRIYDRAVSESCIRLFSEQGFDFNGHGKAEETLIIQ